MEPSPLALLLSKNLLIPLAAIVMPLLVVAIWLYFRQRTARLLHETVRQLAGQGQPVPAELFGRTRQPRSTLHQAWTLIGAGVGLIVGLLTLADLRDYAGLGAIPLAIGLGQWLAFRAEKQTDSLADSRIDARHAQPAAPQPGQPGAGSATASPGSATAG